MFASRTKTFPAVIETKNTIQNETMTTQLPPIALKPAGLTSWNFPEAESIRSVEVATARADDPKPRPDLNGICIIGIGSPSVWLIDQGYRRAFTGANIFLSVYDNFAHVHEVLDVNVIPQGSVISSDFALIQPTDSKTVYLLDYGKKRSIQSIETFDRYHFSRAKIIRIDARAVAAIPDGDALT